VTTVEDAVDIVMRADHVANAKAGALNVLATLSKMYLNFESSMLSGLYLSALIRIRSLT
jgi:hypothetical protein